jgi:hypothetical protein
VPLSSARQNKESGKRLFIFFNTNKQKTNTRTYNVCKSDTKSERCYANKNKELNNYLLSPLLPVVSHFSFVST